MQKRDPSIPSLDGLHKELPDGPKLPSSEKPVHKADLDWYLGTWTWTELCPFNDKMGSLQPSCLYKPCGSYRQQLLSKASEPQFYARHSVSMQPINKEPRWCSCKQCSGRQSLAHVSIMCYQRDLVPNEDHSRHFCHCLKLLPMFLIPLLVWF